MRQMGTYVRQGAVTLFVLGCWLALTTAGLAQDRIILDPRPAISPRYMPGYPEVSPSYPAYYYGVSRYSPSSNTSFRVPAGSSYYNTPGYSYSFYSPYYYGYGYSYGSHLYPSYSSYYRAPASNPYNAYNYYSPSYANPSYSPSRYFRY